MDSVTGHLRNHYMSRLLWSLFMQKRFRYKPKWAIHEKPLTNCQQALGNFDAFYKPFYGKEWPSIRVSLLSMPKYCAAVNRYGDFRAVTEQLCEMGAYDFLLNAEKTELEEALCESQADNQRPLESYQETHCDIDSSPHEQQLDDLTVQPTQVGEDLSLSDDINVFVPTEKVYSEKDLLLREEIDLNSFESRDVTADVLAAEKLRLPADLRAFVFPQGVVSRFPSPKPQGGVLGYYTMDASSVVPVIALNVQANDRVLDMCAAPGGKSYLILQSLDVYNGGTLHCNDSSQARVARLKSVLNLYCPRDVVERVNVSKLNGTSKFPEVYNKVLVDVPCNSDRHVATEDENNLFKVSRTRERLGLTQLQKQLLISAVKCCVPGGTIVYSTCTLSPAQNDGIIQATVEELYETSQIEIAVQDLSTVRQAFRHTFKFHEKARHGLTILPSLLNNFGPSYVAKLRRIK